MAKHKNHTVTIYKYNPENLKEVIGIDEFHIKYIPTKKWHLYLVLVNDVYTGVVMNIADQVAHHFPIREPIAIAIKRYKDGVNEKYENRVKNSYPSLDIAKRVEKNFIKNILPINTFSNRDELTKYQLY